MCYSKIIFPFRIFLCSETNLFNYTFANQIGFTTNNARYQSQIGELEGRDNDLSWVGNSSMSWDEVNQRLYEQETRLLYQGLARNRIIGYCNSQKILSQIFYYETIRVDVYVSLYVHLFRGKHDFFQPLIKIEVYFVCADSPYIFVSNLQIFCSSVCRSGHKGKKCKNIETSIFWRLFKIEVCIFFL